MVVCAVKKNLTTWGLMILLGRKVKEGIFEKHPTEESEPFEYLGEEVSICLMSEEVQRPCGGNTIGIARRPLWEELIT